MQKIMTVDEINKAGAQLRKPAEPTPPPNEVAQAMKLVAEAITNMRPAPAPHVIVNDNDEALLAALTKLFKQNQDMLKVLKEALEPGIMEAPPPPPKEQWHFDIVRDDYGHIKSVKARQL